MKSNFAEKERRVLQKLYDERERRHTNPHVPEELARDLKLDVDEVYDIINELEGQGLIGGTDEASWIIPPGIKLIESDDPRAGTASNVSFTTNIHGPNYGGIQQGGKGNTQNITLTNTHNSDFDRALASLVELIRSSQIQDDDKQELEEEVGKVNKLALREPTSGLLDRAKSRLDMIKLAVTGTDIAIKAAPHLDTIWELLKQRFGG